MKYLSIVLVWAGLSLSAAPSDPTAAPAAAAAEESFVIKKPGEITFTTGIVIEGRIEKPQVMLVLTKERVKMEPLKFTKSFVDNIIEPVRYNTFDIIKSGEKAKADPGTGTPGKTRNP